MKNPVDDLDLDDNTDLKTLVECLESVRKKGFKEDFKVDNGMMTGINTQRSYSPEQVNILNFYRFEGDSDPADNSILYVIETDDCLRGTLVDGYGPTSDPDVQPFLEEVENIKKKKPNEKL